MNEILLLKARLAEKKKALEEMQLKADSYIIVLRDIFDPYIEDFTTIDAERGEVIAKDFKHLCAKGKELKAQIAKMEKDLNG